MFKIPKRGSNKKLFLYALICGLIATVASGLMTGAVYSEETQRGIASQVIRFHIRANSDSDADQNLKMLVKNAVIHQLHDGLAASQSLDETRTYLAANLDAVKACAERVIAENGYRYPVSVYLCRDYFPTKTYGDVSLPPGTYEALRIDIGEAAGHNWWCVMFPPLCFVDAAESEVPEADKQQLQNILTEDEYALVTEDDAPVKVKFTS